MVMQTVAAKQGDGLGFLLPNTFAVIQGRKQTENENEWGGSRLVRNQSAVFWLWLKQAVAAAECPLKPQKKTKKQNNMTASVRVPLFGIFNSKGLLETHYGKKPTCIGSLTGAFAVSTMKCTDAISGSEKGRAQSKTADANQNPLRNVVMLCIFVFQDSWSRLCWQNSQMFKTTFE